MEFVFFESGGVTLKAWPSDPSTYHVVSAEGFEMVDGVLTPSTSKALEDFTEATAQFCAWREGLKEH